MAFLRPRCVPRGRLYLPDVRDLYSAQKTGQHDWGPFTDKEGETRGEVMSPSQGHGAAGWQSQASGSRLWPFRPPGQAARLGPNRPQPKGPHVLLSPRPRQHPRHPLSVSVGSWYPVPPAGFGGRSSPWKTASLPSSPPMS